MSRGAVAYLDAHTQYGNLGDVVINRELVRLLREHAEVVVDERKAPGWFVELLELRDSERVSLVGGGFKRRVAIDAIRVQLARRRGLETHPPHLVLKPGHIGGPTSTRELFTRIGLLVVSALYRALGVKISRFGFSVGALEPAMQRVERLQALTMHRYSPRDPISRSYAEGLGIHSASSSPDLAFHLPKRVPGERHALDRISLSFRPSMAGTGSDESYAGSLGERLRELRGAAEERRISVVGCAQVVTDQRFLDRLQRDGVVSETCVFDRSVAGRDAVFDHLATVDVLVTNRLHALLFALAQGTLAVALTEPASHGKIVGLLEELDLGELLIPLGDVDGAKLLRRIEDLHARRDVLLHTIDAVFQKQKAELNDVMARAFNDEALTGGER